MAGMGAANRGQSGSGHYGEKNGKNGMPVISPVIVGIGLAISFLMVIGAGVFVVSTTPVASLRRVRLFVHAEVHERHTTRARARMHTGHTHRQAHYNRS